MIRIAYSLIISLALIPGCGFVSLGQDNPGREKTTSAAAASPNSKVSDAPVPAPSSSPERTANKSISKSDRENAKRSYKAGLKYGRGGLVRQAIESFEQAIGYDPEFADAHSALGQAYFDLGRYDDAVVVLQKAVKLNPAAAGSQALLVQVQTKLKEKSVPEKTSEPVSIESTAPSKKPDAGGAERTGTDSDPTALYYVGISDVLDIRLPGGASEESTLHIVAGNGHLDHPILGRPIKVSGLTTDQIAALFSVELERLSITNQPAPEVSVRDFNSHTILVSGLVKEPGTKILRREAIPLYVVLADAQPLTDAGLVDIMSQGAVKHRAIDLAQPEQTAVLVRPGDVVTVRAAKKQFFYAGGNVKSPGELPFRSGLTLTQAIMSAGGVTLKGERVQLTRGQGNGLLTMKEFKLKEINSGKVPDPLIEPGDRITVLP